jgi:hypothetical protein
MCPTKSKNHGSALKNWISDLDDVQEKEKVCIVSGEGYHPIMEALYYHFEKCAKKREAELKVIIGPVVCVDSNGKNPLFKLAQNNLMTLYKASSRERLHFRTFGYRKAFAEDYHPAVTQPSKRNGLYYNDPLIVSKFVTNFENKINAFNLPKYKGNFDVEDFVCLTPDQIERLRAPFGEYYDSLFEEEIRKLVVAEDITKTPLFHTFKLCYV